MTGPAVLVVAGSDSSGGAGIARDIATLTALGCTACPAITAVTAQTHGRAGDIALTAPSLVAAQMRAAFESQAIGAVKIGMLGSSAIVAVVAEVLATHGQVPVVLDPVLATTSGARLLDDDALDPLRERLMPLCTLVTPNFPELAALSGSPVAEDDAAAIRQGEALLATGCVAVLLKGGHATGGSATDILLRPAEEPLRFEAPHLAATMRGTGCMLASAIAAHLAKGGTLDSSVGAAKSLVTAALVERADAHAPQR